MPMKGGVPYYLMAGLILLVTLAVIPWNAAHNQISFSDARIVAFIGALAGVMGVAGGISVEITNNPLGVLAGGRNVYSLARLQMILWSWVVISALLAIVVCRAWGLLNGGNLNTALNVEIDHDLLLTMGISFFTGAATPAVLALKSSDGDDVEQSRVATARMGEDVYVRRKVIWRTKNRPPRLADFIRGDEVGSAGVVDLSKLQQLLLTLIVLGAYTAMLFGLFSNGPSDSQQSLGHTQFPPFSPDFVRLLLVSHAGYLGYSIVPKPDPPAEANPQSNISSSVNPAQAGPVMGGPPPTPDRNSTIQPTRDSGG